MDARYVFVAGLHRSGTSLLTDLLARSTDRIATLRNTGVPEDEGQHVQSVIPAANRFGGPGRFALARGVRLNDGDAAHPDGLREKFEADWAPYWSDPELPIRLEKSPPTLVRTRYFQEVFPGARFVVIVRHPAVVALATEKWKSRYPIAVLIENWRAAHRRFLADLPHLADVKWVNYETLVATPEPVIESLLGWLGTEREHADATASVDPSVGERYASMWVRRGRSHPTRLAMRRVAGTAAAFGYTADVLTVAGPCRNAEIEAIRVPDE